MESDFKMLRIFKFDSTKIEEEIESFEKKNEMCLPREYKKFLLKYNGGNTIDTRFKINEVSSDIRAFYGFKNVPKNYDIVSFTDIDFFLEKGLFPIAEDSLGNKIVIGVKNKNQENIYFFDHELSEFSYVINNLKLFFGKIKSKEVVIPSIEERIREMKVDDSNFEVDDEWIEIWQAEIDKYSGNEQETVII